MPELRCSLNCLPFYLAPGRLMKTDCWILLVKYSYFEKGCGKKSARDNPERQYGIWSIHCFWHCSCRTCFCCFALALGNIRPWPLVPFIQNFYEEQWSQNHPRYLSGLSRALFPTTFFEIAVYQTFWSVARLLIAVFPYNRESLRQIFITYVENSNKVNPTAV